ncbi:MAG: RNA-binding cell elongation regulator Jag/EloR [Lachnospirales bacterium]
MDFSEKWGKDVETATELALKDLKCSREEVKINIIEEPSKGFFGLGSKLALVRVEKIDKSIEKEEKEPLKKGIDIRKEARVEKSTKPENLKKVENHEAVDFLKDTTSKMGLKLNFETFIDETSIYIDIEGEDARNIIGKRGQTLDAIQYLTSLVVNKQKEGYTRVVLDAENYREKREKTLEQLAERLAGKVVKTGKSVKLEPMNPYERMVIHATLQKNDKIKTRSEGEEPYRRLVIELK